MSTNSNEKSKCWRLLSNLKNAVIVEHWIITGDLNIIRTGVEKRGRIFGRDPYWNNLEEIFSNSDLLDIPPRRGSFTWTNMRAGPGHIATWLDCFFVHCSHLHRNFSIKTFILPSLISDHKPISLHLQALPNFGPSPYGSICCGFIIERLWSWLKLLGTPRFWGLWSLFGGKN